MEMNRRTFIETAAGAAIAANIAAPAIADEGINPTETYDCDIVIVGAGLSGLCACVEAGHQGLSTICVEGMSVTGGGAGMGVEGSFGIESSLTKAMNLHVDPREVYATEMVNSQWRADGGCWMDFMYQSGANIDWLIEQGVMFEPTVDDYHGKDFNTFHWYKDGACGVGFVPPMTAKAEELGVQFMFETLGKKLIQNEDGEVCGLYAQKKESDDYIRINAKAVILASGGIGSNKELVSQIGYPIDQLDCMFEFATGNGYLMATEIGAHSMMGVTADQSGSYFPGYMKGMDNIMWAVAPQLLWVNEDAARFFPEDNSIVCLSNSNAPKLAQKAHYALWDTAMMKDYTERNCITGNYIGDIIDSAIAEGGQGLYRADTVEDRSIEHGAVRLGLAQIGLREVGGRRLIAALLPGYPGLDGVRHLRCHRYQPQLPGHHRRKRPNPRPIRHRRRRCHALSQRLHHRHPWLLLGLVHLFGAQSGPTRR